MISTEQLEADGVAAIPSDALLSRIRDLVGQLVTVDARIVKGEAYLKQLNKEAHDLRHYELPKACQAAGISQMTMSDGSRFEVELNYFTSIPTQEAANKDDEAANRRAAAFDWLRENGAGSLIQNKISIDLETGQDELLAKVLEAVGQLGLSAKTQETANWQRLRSLVKERHAAGLSLPSELAAQALPEAKFKKAKLT